MNHKRPYDDRREGRHPQQHHQHKKQKTAGPRHHHDPSALAKLPPATNTPPHVAAYTPFTVPSNTLPPLPPIPDPTLAIAPFKHKSSLTHYDRTASIGITYEKLEFLGDAQIELIASRLLYARFSHLPAGQQSQLRELLVKNETLAAFAKMYGFEERVQVGDLDNMVSDTKDGKGNKGFLKVLADVFEAYVAAVILSHGDEGFALAETWLTALWAPKLVEQMGGGKYALALQHDPATADPLKTYNPQAKMELQKKVLSAQMGVKLEYEPYQASIELKGDQLGQNRHFIALYLTGYGYERKLLGKGEGRNKVEAGNWAAARAMNGEYKGLLEECHRQMEEFREKKRKEKEEREAAAAVA